MNPKKYMEATDMSLFQILAICGMISPILYTLMWILGGFLRSDYSHIRDDISSLFAVGLLESDYLMC